MRSTGGCKVRRVPSAARRGARFGRQSQSASHGRCPDRFATEADAWSRSTAKAETDGNCGTRHGSRTDQRLVESGLTARSFSLVPCLMSAGLHTLPKAGDDRSRSCGMITTAHRFGFPGRNRASWATNSLRARVGRVEPSGYAPGPHPVTPSRPESPVLTSPIRRVSHRIDRTASRFASVSGAGARRVGTGFVRRGRQSTWPGRPARGARVGRRSPRPRRTPSPATQSGLGVSLRVGFKRASSPGSTRPREPR